MSMKELLDACEHVISRENAIVLCSEMCRFVKSGQFENWCKHSNVSFDMQRDAIARFRRNCDIQSDTTHLRGCIAMFELVLNLYLLSEFKQPINTYTVYDTKNIIGTMEIFRIFSSS